MRSLFFSLTFAGLAACSGTSPVTFQIPQHRVIGVEQEHLDAQYWIDRTGDPRRVLLTKQAIEVQNAKLRRIDPSVYDLEGLPTEIPVGRVLEWITKVSVRPQTALYDEQGSEISASQLDALEHALALERIPSSQSRRYGLIVHRASLRAFPTTLRTFRSPHDADIDRFQESALFPGTPVAIVHTSRDGEWYFVVSPLYAAWVERQYVAEGSAAEVFEYARKSPYIVITGATARTVFTRERPELSELQLEMGVRVPLVSNWPPDMPVNGQHPYTGHVIQLPWRDPQGSLRFSPALLPKTAEAGSSYLVLDRANLLRQSFKFLGERYGWGHSYNGRDCSGFVSEVYRSFGIELPRNTRDQAVSPALRRMEFADGDSLENRLAVIRTLQIGDLVYIPGHVMMVIGHKDGTPYVIHDTTGISYEDEDGEVRHVRLNGVSVTPLSPLLLADNHSLIKRIYSIVFMRAH